jgi:hypothetical protein
MLHVGKAQVHYEKYAKYSKLLSNCGDLRREKYIEFGCIAFFLDVPAVVKTDKRLRSRCEFEKKGKQLSHFLV